MGAKMGPQRESPESWHKEVYRIQGEEGRASFLWGNKEGGGGAGRRVSY